MKSPLLILLAGARMAGAVAFAQAPRAQESPLAPLVRHIISHPGDHAPWPVDFEAPKGDRQ